jgi:hypothetical protein
VTKTSDIVNSVPVNSVAAKVVSKGFSYTFESKSRKTTDPVFAGPPEIKAYVNDQQKIMHGKRFGSLVVVGCAAVKTNGSAKYVCRCDCGNYCYRYARAIKIGSLESRCSECDARHELKRLELFRRTGKQSPRLFKEG